MHTAQRSGTHTEQRQGITINLEELFDGLELLHFYRRQIDQFDLLRDEELIPLAEWIERDKYVKQARSERPQTLRATDEQREIERRATQARWRMVEANLRLVVFIARRYADYGVDLMDLIQEGNLGLMHAVEKFDHSKGKFSSYASRWIRRAILRALVIQAPHTLLTKREKYDEIKRLKLLLKQLEQDAEGGEGELSSEEDLATQMHMSERRLKNLLALLSSNLETLSLDVPLQEGDESTMLSDVMEDDPKYTPEQEVISQTLETKVRELLDNLKPDEKRVLQLRYGFDDGKGQSLSQIGKRMNISIEGVRQIELRALRKLAQLSRDLHEFL